MVYPPLSKKSATASESESLSSLKRNLVRVFANGVHAIPVTGYRGPSHGQAKLFTLLSTTHDAEDPASSSRASSLRLPDRCPQRLRSPMLTFAAKKLSTGANGQRKEDSDGASFFQVCPRSFDRVFKELGGTIYNSRRGRPPTPAVSK